jgi:hypothetical protein
MTPFLEKVTLIVYGWQGNEPGTLSWVFPSLTAAMSAVRAMKNAVKWLIIASTETVLARDEEEEVDVEEVRRSSVVLFEKFA